MNKGQPANIVSAKTLIFPDVGKYIVRTLISSYMCLVMKTIESTIVLSSKKWALHKNSMTKLKWCNTGNLKLQNQYCFFDYMLKKTSNSLQRMELELTSYQLCFKNAFEILIPLQVFEALTQLVDSKLFRLWSYIFLGHIRGSKFVVGLYLWLWTVI